MVYTSFKKYFFFPCEQRRTGTVAVLALVTGSTSGSNPVSTSFCGIRTVKQRAWSGSNKKGARDNRKMSPDRSTAVAKKVRQEILITYLSRLAQETNIHETIKQASCLGLTFWNPLPFALPHFSDGGCTRTRTVSGLEVLRTCIVYLFTDIY